LLLPRRFKRKPHPPAYGLRRLRRFTLPNESGFNLSNPRMMDVDALLSPHADANLAGDEVTSLISNPGLS
jgi:hypothetical protein